MNEDNNRKKRTIKTYQARQPSMSSMINKDSIFGRNKLEINEEGASNLVGSIIERGISENTQNNSLLVKPPKVTILPFPEARHRAHGPHWGPVKSKMPGGDKDENDVDDEEEHDFAKFDPISAFANPVQRKQKKNLDLSRWREVVSSDDSFKTGKMEENGLRLKKAGMQGKDGEAMDDAGKKNMLHEPYIVDEASMEVDSKQCLNSGLSLSRMGEAMPRNVNTVYETSAAEVEIDNSDQLVKESGGEASSGCIDVEVGSTASMSRYGNSSAQLQEMEIEDPSLTEMQEAESSILVSGRGLNNYGIEKQSMSLRAEIDVENCARLQNMSPEEIAEAQAEIMQKMNPALLNLLRRRGQEKLKNQNFSTPNQGIKDQPDCSPCENHLSKTSNASLNVKIDHSDKQEKSTSKETANGMENAAAQNLRNGSGSLWNTWSERVEAVRGLKFSLEGDVIANDPDKGNTPLDSGRSIDSVAERDILRTEGDPGAAGYTIKEAVQLTRSVIPGQRALAFHLLASLLDNAMHNIQKNPIGNARRDANQGDQLVDWEAIWAYALGPEPELVLSLRICLDDNHNSVVLACAKVIQCILTCDRNEKFFDISGKIATHEGNIFTAPVFRSKPEADNGFLRGGFWKYNTKPSNIEASPEDVIDDEGEEQQTIGDDIVVAGQDIAAGLVRMDILPRLRYLLETNPASALEECVVSILIAIARRSVTCANAIMKCQRLVQIVVQRFTTSGYLEIHPSMIKSVRLLKVLAQADKRNCIRLIKKGYFETMTWHLYRDTSSIDQWIMSGRENCKLSSALMVEQLRFWKVCIHYGCCISYFSDIFPALCLWMNPPSFKKIQDNNVLSEFALLSTEVFLVLEAMARKLPSFYSQNDPSNQVSNCAGDEMETWSWRYITPIVDSALKWITSKSDPYVCKLFETILVSYNLPAKSLLWVYSAIMHMLSTMLERLNPKDSTGATQVPWLPEFVPKIGLGIIRNKFLSFWDASSTEDRKHYAGSDCFISELCHLRQQRDSEILLASACCLHGLVRVVTFVDNLVQLSKSGAPPSEIQNFSEEGEILADGILRRSGVELKYVLDVFVKMVESEWHNVQSIEFFGRGGPAPGLGLGWGASGGGFWSMAVLLAQTDAHVLIHTLDIFHKGSEIALSMNTEMAIDSRQINSLLSVCLTMGPRDRTLLEKALDILLRGPVFKHLDDCIRQFLQSNERMELFNWEYNEDDILLFGKILASHFKGRWLSVKKKLKATENGNTSGKRTSKKVGSSLGTIHEDVDASHTSEDHCMSLAAEWAHQRLPLPTHWFFSSVATISDNEQAGLQNFMPDTSELPEVAKAGLFYLLGMEAVSNFLPTNVPSPVRNVPLVWKLHCLSIVLLVGMGVLEDDRSRDVYRALQEFYGQLVDEERLARSAEHVLKDNSNLSLETGNKRNMEFLDFQTEVHESYSTFLEALIEQFAAISYGDGTFGRQVAVYLHQCTEAPVRRSAWNLLSNTRVLDILPPLEACIGEAEGYLDPIEDDESILEAYVKSWSSGALDRAATRGSMAYTLVLHHLSSFIFQTHINQKLSLRNKLVKTLLRDFSQNKRREVMMLNLIQYKKPPITCMHGNEKDDLIRQQNSYLERKFEALIEACDKNCSLLIEVGKLKSLVK